MLTLYPGRTCARGLAVGLLLALLGGTSSAAELSVPSDVIAPTGPYGAAGMAFGDADFGNDKLQLGARARFAGAIASLKYGGVEFIDAEDHGRELQMAVSLNSGPECLMPTEAGSAEDADKPTTTSVLLDAQAGNASWQTRTQPAYWLRKLDPPPPPPRPNGCQPEHVSPEIFTKQIQVGHDGDAQVIRYAGQMQLAANYPMAYAEIPTIYLQERFNLQFRMDPATGETWQYKAILSNPRNGVPSDLPTEEAANTVLIWADGRNGDSNAIGLWSPQEAEGADFQYRAHYFDFTHQHGAQYNTSKLTMTRSWGANPPREISAVGYFAVGSLDSVRRSLARLYQANPTHVERKWPLEARREPPQLPPIPTDPEPPVPVHELSAFDQASPDVASQQHVTQTGISDDGTRLIQRVYANGWQSWRSSAINSVIPTLNAVRSFSQGPDGQGNPKQYFVNRSGEWIHSRTFRGGVWSGFDPSKVSDLRIWHGSGYVQKIRSFDQVGPDPAIGNRLKEIVVSDDGRTSYYRYYDFANGTWSNWIAGGVSGLNIPGVTAINSLSQSVTPEGYAKFHLLTDDGRTIYTRTLQGGVWSQWAPVSVSALGMTR